MPTEGLHVDLAKPVNFSPCALNCIFGVFYVSGTQFWTMKTPLDHVLRVCQSIFEIVSIFSPGPVIANFGVLRFKEINSEQENPSGLTIEGLNVDCAKKSIPYVDYNGIFGLLWLSWPWIMYTSDQRGQSHQFTSKFLNWVPEIEGPQNLQSRDQGENIATFSKIDW